MPKSLWYTHGFEQSGFQSGPETAPLAAVCARYCQPVSHFTAKSSDPY